MDESTWTRVREVFEEAVERPAGERARFVARACEGDQDLRAEVERLLEADTGPPGPVDHASERLGQGLGQGLGQLASVVEVQSLLGRKIGAYTLLRVVASGGMGTIFEASQERPERRVALKVMRHGLGSASAVRRFHDEAEVLGALSHPGIAQVFEAGSLTEGEGAQAREVPWFAMEFVEGARTIVEFAEGERLSIQERVALFARVCDTVHYGHGRGVIHRDLKPGNLLVDRGGHVKVIDFGIARATTDACGDRGTSGTAPSDSTMAGEILGTLHYMAPEQMLGEPQRVDTRSDVYALGVVLYELICGTGPYELSGLGLPQVVKLVTEREPTAPEVLRPGLARDLAWIMTCAVSRDPDLRYASCDAFAADLRRFLAREPVQAGPPTRRYRVAKFIERHKSGVVTALILLVLSVVVPLAFAVHHARLNARYERLADLLRLDELEEQAAALWPAVPERAEAMRAWLQRAETLVARGEVLRASSARAGGAASDAERWRRAMSATLIQRLAAFDAPHGTRAAVREGLTLAETIERRSIEEHAAAWDDTLRQVARSPHYDGLKLAPQLGLVPLGADPRSGLFEFAHLPSGRLPRRDAAGELVLDGESAIVLVLLPSAAFRMGAARTDGSRGPSPNPDPHAEFDESPVHAVLLDPFFLGKHELTQAQWQRATGENPSYFDGELLRAYGLVDDPATARMHPVETVDWIAAQRVLQRWGLELPSEAQWEYAARAGTSTPWWSGASRDTLIGRINIADASARDVEQDWPVLSEWPDFVDGYPFHARVGSLPANSFGLHEILGNVMEWCAGELEPYPDAFGETPTAAPKETFGRAVRGGSFYHGALDARVSKRGSYETTGRDLFLGLRAARDLDP